MPQRSLASLVLAPVLFGILLLGLACVAGVRTDRLADTVAVVDSLSRASDDSLAAQQIAVSQPAGIGGDTARQQGEPAATSGTGGGRRVESTSNGTSPHRHARRMLSPLADSIAEYLVVVPADRAWFTAASRGRRMLVDLGRIDMRLGTDSSSRAAYDEAMRGISPLPLGTPLRLRGPWGSDDVKVSGFDVWHGRIVARVAGSRQLDSLARATDMLPATATRIVASVSTPVDSARVQPTPAACVHDTSSVLATRALAVRDSLARYLTDSVAVPYERMAASVRIVSWWTPGCFGPAQALVVASKRTPDMDFAVERGVLVDSLGAVTTLRFSDFRFKAHDALYVFDADGDGVDDLAAKGYGDRSGGLTILRLDPTARRLTRLTSGFAWEQ